MPWNPRIRKPHSTPFAAMRRAGQSRFQFAGRGESTATQTAGGAMSDTGVAHLGRPIAGKLAIITHGVELIMVKADGAAEA